MARLEGGLGRGRHWGDSTNMLSNRAVRSASLRSIPGRANRLIPVNQEMTSMAAMMLAADRMAANVLAANSDLRDGLYRKYLGASEDWLRSHGASEAEAAQETLDWVEQITRRLVAMRLAKLLDTTAQEEQRA
jgi:hypothetical protein